jgi:hypothetical protein
MNSLAMRLPLLKSRMAAASGQKNRLAGNRSPPHRFSWILSAGSCLARADNPPCGPPHRPVRCPRRGLDHFVMKRIALGPGGRPRCNVYGSQGS